MNVLISQGMDKQQAQAQVQAQMAHMHSQQKQSSAKESRNQGMDIRPSGSQHSSSISKKPSSGRQIGSNRVVPSDQLGGQKFSYLNQ